MPRWGDAKYDPRVMALLDGLRVEQQEIAEHEIYGRLDQIENVRVFMEHHVFAVWDFMSLLTALRSQVTAVNVPWRPIGSAATRRFVNELMLAEESDTVGDGYTSHFELYLNAMEAVSADTGPIRRFAESFRGEDDLDLVLRASGAPAAAGKFVSRTWKAVASRRPTIIVGSFAFGRESLIPSMFSALLPLVERQPELSLFCDYLDRHIQLDEDVHTPLAFNIVSEVCGEDERRWNEVRIAASEALSARRAMWDDIVTALAARVPVEVGLRPTD